MLLSENGGGEAKTDDARRLRGFFFFSKRKMGQFKETIKKCDEKVGSSDRCGVQRMGKARKVANVAIGQGEEAERDKIKPIGGHLSPQGMRVFLEVGESSRPRVG